VRECVGKKDTQKRQLSTHFVRFHPIKRTNAKREKQQKRRTLEAKLPKSIPTTDYIIHRQPADRQPADRNESACFVPLSRGREVYKLTAMLVSVEYQKKRRVSRDGWLWSLFEHDNCVRERCALN
jgi:hypothetical protein